MKLKIINPLVFFGFSGLVLIAAIFYNAGLAFLNAHGIAVGTLQVALTEAVIVAVSLVYIVFKIKSFPNIMPPFFFMVFMICMFLMVSFLNEHFYPKALRDMMLVAVFFMIGGTATEKTLFSTFRFVTAAILITMVIEGWMTDIYVSLFEPAKYYASTRGLEMPDSNNTGLFSASLGYKGRFSFGVFHTHRLSSLFLEQISLANFSIVLAIFLSTFWSSLKRWDRVLYFFTVVFIILTTNSRTASIICSMILVGHFVFPILPRYFHLLYLPAIIIMSAILFYDPNMDVRLQSDDLQGRIGHTMANMATMGDAYFTGGTLNEVFRMMDSGMTYLIMTQTVFGLIAFWLFTGLIIPGRDASDKRFNHGVALYLFLNLLTSGSVLSIKVSAPLFFILGYLYYKKVNAAAHVEKQAVHG